MRALWRGALIAALIAGGGAAGAQDAPMTPAQWREDIDFVVSTIERVHPMPFARVEEETFRADAEALRDLAENGAAEEIAVGLMRLVALLQDGHTELDPSPMEPFASGWYPLRFYVFEDGVYLTAVGGAQADLVGARVETIGGADAGAAIEAASALSGADNEFGARENVFWASSAPVMAALGYADEDGTLRLGVVDAGGEAREVAIAPLGMETSFDWRFWGEMHTPLDDEIGSVGWGGRSSAEFRPGDDSVPLFLRDQRAFHVAVLEDEGVVYFQFNYVARDYRDETFDDAYARIFEALDADPARRFVLDIRYNFGGDGSILQPFVHEIIRRPRLMRSGRLVVITGRQTFSAGVNLLSALVQHVDPVLVGEPAGAGENAFGNAESFTLPNSGMNLTVSAVLHVGTSWTEEPGRDHRLIPVDFPTPMTGAEYFAGRDPAMELVLGGADLRSLEAVAAAEDAERLRAVYEARQAAYGEIDWWRATDMWGMNAAGNYLRRDGERAEDTGLIERGVAALAINAEVYPEWWNSWDSLAEAHMAAGRNDVAIELYERSLALNPGNGNARHMLEMLRETEE